MGVGECEQVGERPSAAASPASILRPVSPLLPRQKACYFTRGFPLSLPTLMFYMPPRGGVEWEGNIICRYSRLPPRVVYCWKRLEAK